MSGECAISRLVEQAAKFMRDTPITLNDGLTVVDIDEAVRHTIDAVYPYDPRCLLRDYPLWCGRLADLNDRVGTRGSFWTTANYFNDGNAPHDVFASLVRELTASVLTKELAKDLELVALGNERNANYRSIIEEAAEEALVQQIADREAVGTMPALSVEM